MIPDRHGSVTFHDHISPHEDVTILPGVRNGLDGFWTSLMVQFMIVMFLQISVKRVDLSSRDE